jgi:hemerythrin
VKSAILNKVLNLRLRAEDREGALSLDMIHDLASWLNQHTWKYDLKLVQFIQQQKYREELLYN